MGEQNQPKEDRRFAVLKLLPQERELLRQLGCGSEKAEGWCDRDTVMCELIEYVRKLDLPKKPPTPPRRSLRVSLPDVLDELLKERAEETGLPEVHILIEAVKLFREKYPLEEPKEEDKPAS